MLVRLGDRVEKAQPLVRVFAHHDKAEAARQMVADAITLSDQPVKAPPLIVQRIEPK